MSFMGRFTALFLFVLVTASYALAQYRIAPAIQPYTSCRFDDGLSIVQLDALPTTPMVRTIQTPSGEKQVTMVEGERIMFAYPSEDFYANVKAEQLDPKDYTREKADLVAELTSLASDGKAHVEPSLAPIHRFEVHGLNRSKLEGGVLGTYVLFDDKQSVVTTIYLLNGEPEQRRFQTLPEYAEVRDHFLSQYTACVRVNEEANSRTESDDVRPAPGAHRR